MLEVTTVSQEQRLGVDFSDLYKKSELYQWVTYNPPIHFISRISYCPYVAFSLNYTTSRPGEQNLCWKSLLTLKI